MIIDELKRKALKLVEEEFRVLDFSFALPYSFVLIEGSRGKSLGVAMTLLEEIQICDSEFDDISVEAFIEKADSLNVVERTLGLATINAVSQYYFDLSTANVEDAINVVFRESVKRIAIVGNITPIANALRSRGYEVYVFERNPKLAREETLSDAFEYRLLPKMDAVLISGTSLINDTLDFVLERSKKAKLKVLIGATAQALPEFFKGYVTHVASTKFTDIDKVLLSLKLGSASKLFDARCSKKYTVSLG
jgi:uncharacterized protein (DUF4213/DUF364 family)